MKITEITTKISGIYKINFPNNKIYIGRAVDIKRRIKEHYNKEDGTPCYKALIKYYTNVNNIDFDILYIQSILNLEELKEKEKYYIKLYDARNKIQGYNITEGGEGADYGVYNIASKISKEELNDIINRLKNGESNIEIGKIYNLHPDTIGRINNGTTYYNECLEYPLREISIKVEGFKNEELSIDAMQHKDSWELQLEFLKERENEYDGLILDLKLDDLPNNNDIRAKFRGTSLAQEIRTRQKEGILKSFPIILFSANDKTQQALEKSGTDLFDILIDKSKLDDIAFPIYTRQLIELSKGYKYLCDSSLTTAKYFRPMILLLTQDL